MLGSLFGDLAPQRLPAANSRPGEKPDRVPVAATAAVTAATTATAAATVATVATAATGAPAARSEDVVVDASPAAAIRSHFAAHRGDLQHASSMITLLDPSRLWASQVVQALSEAGGQPVQRLNLRERATLRTLAVIERTLVPRRDAGALRVYHADIRASAMEQGLAQDEISNALAEGSQLTAVIVGALQPHALLALLRSLLQATRQPEWRCPQLLFMLPPSAAALRQRILEQHWPARVRASAVAEPLACAASVWNRVLESWSAAQPWLPTPPPPPSIQPADGPGGAARLPPALTRLLAPLATSDGLLACGIVDLSRGDLLASQSREPPSTDLAGLALALCAARRAHQSMAGDARPPDEILITAGPRQTLLRTLPGDGSLGFVALLDRQQTNLALLRFKLLEAERLFA